MLQNVGRLLVRKGKTAGVFFPIGDASLEPGLYDVMDIMGETSLRRIGEPHMDEVRLNALDLEGVFNERPSTCMTKAELLVTDQLRQKN